MPHGRRAPRAPPAPPTSLDEATRASWLGAAFAWASENGVTLFDYHGLVKREVDSYLGNPGGYLWESGIVENPSGAYTPSVRALRDAAVAARSWADVATRC